MFNGPWLDNSDVILRGLATQVNLGYRQNAMKTIPLALAIAALAPLAHAVEYVTLTGNTQTKALAAGALVEVIGTNKNNDGNVEYLRFTFADGFSAKMTLRGKESYPFSDMKGNSFTGATSVSLEQSNGNPVTLTCVTLKITPANEIGVTPPGTVLVLPEDATGSYTVVTESSNDLVNWTTMTTTPVVLPSAPKFYRSRIIKTAP